MEKPVLHLPLDSTIKIISPFWKDFSNDPVKSTFYTLFDNHHPGVDFGCEPGIEVFASFKGVVVRKEFHKGMGNVIGIRNGNIVALYAHLSEMSVSLGETINEKQHIGMSGNTGEATTIPHLHFELRDLTKGQLKEMVFKPEFEKIIENWQQTFSHVIKNENTQKTWKFLAERYLGDKTKWKLFLKENDSLTKFAKDEVLPEGIEVIIPNFE